MPVSNKLEAQETGLFPPAEFTPIDQPGEDDIFIVGYPKSGNTWMQNIMGGLVYGIENTASNAAVNELVPDVHYATSYRRRRPVMFFKTHSLPVSHYKRVVYLMRDGRDAMVSYYHYLSAMLGKPVDFLRMVETGDELFPCKWGRHVTEWMKNPYGADMITIRYEDLIRDPLVEMGRLCKFAGLPRSKEYLECVARDTTFEGMRGKESKYGMGVEWPKDRFFMRRGKVGSYVDEMPPPVLAAFQQECREALRECGYLRQ